MAECPHPAARILLWCGWAVAVETVAASGLPLLAVAAATAFLFSHVRAQVSRLLRRTRWLLAVLLLTYGYAMPGTPLWAAAGWASPTVDGVEAGAVRIVRLVLMLVALGALLAWTSRPRLIYGLYGLAKPLARLGFDRRAFAVRLGLTLDYVEHAPARARWLDALKAPLPDDGAPASYTLQAERWHACDTAVILAGLAGVVLVAL